MPNNNISHIKIHEGNDNILYTLQDLQTRCMLAQEYSTDTTYNFLDMVTYEDKLYKCYSWSPIINQLPSNNTYWSEINLTNLFSYFLKELTITEYEVEWEQGGFNASGGTPGTTFSSEKFGRVPYTLTFPANAIIVSDDPQNYQFSVLYREPGSNTWRFDKRSGSLKFQTHYKTSDQYEYLLEMRNNSSGEGAVGSGNNETITSDAYGHIHIYYEDNNKILAQFTQLAAQETSFESNVSNILQKIQDICDYFALNALTLKPEWEGNKSLSSTTGAIQSNYLNRWASLPIPIGNVEKGIDIPNNIACIIYGYSNSLANTNSYIGFLTKPRVQNNIGYTKELIGDLGSSVVRNNFFTKQDSPLLVNFSNVKYIRILAVKVDESNYNTNSYFSNNTVITLEDVKDFRLLSYTDKSLTYLNKAADAQAVGQALQQVLNTMLNDYYTVTEWTPSWSRTPWRIDYTKGSQPKDWQQCLAFDSPLECIHGRIEIPEGYSIYLIGDLNEEPQDLIGNAVLQLNTATQIGSNSIYQDMRIVNLPIISSPKKQKYLFSVRKYPLSGTSLSEDEINFIRSNVKVYTYIPKVDTYQNVIDQKISWPTENGARDVGKSGYVLTSGGNGQVYWKKSAATAAAAVINTATVTDPNLPVYPETYGAKSLDILDTILEPDLTAESQNNFLSLQRAINVAIHEHRVLDGNNKTYLIDSIQNQLIVARSSDAATSTTAITSLATLVLAYDGIHPETNWAPGGVTIKLNDESENCYQVKIGEDSSGNSIYEDAVFFFLGPNPYIEGGTASSPNKFPYGYVAIYDPPTYTGQDDQEGNPIVTHQFNNINGDQKGLNNYKIIPSARLSLVEDFYNHKWLGGEVSYHHHALNVYGSLTMQNLNLKLKDFAVHGTTLLSLYCEPKESIIIRNCDINGNTKYFHTYEETKIEIDGIDYTNKITINDTPEVSFATFYNETHNNLAYDSYPIYSKPWTEKKAILHRNNIEIQENFYIDPYIPYFDHRSLPDKTGWYYQYWDDIKQYSSSRYFNLGDDGHDYYSKYIIETPYDRMGAKAVLSRDWGDEFSFNQDQTLCWYADSSIEPVKIPLPEMPDSEGVKHGIAIRPYKTQLKKQFDRQLLEDTTSWWDSNVSTSVSFDTTARSFPEIKTQDALEGVMGSILIENCNIHDCFTDNIIVQRCRYDSFIIQNCIISHAGRNGITNNGRNTTVDNCTFNDNGMRHNPRIQYEVEPEMLMGKMYKQTISNCTFKRTPNLFGTPAFNNRSDITFLLKRGSSLGMWYAPWLENLIIENCTFNRGSIQTYGNYGEFNEFLEITEAIFKLLTFDQYGRISEISDVNKLVSEIKKCFPMDSATMDVDHVNKAGHFIASKPMINASLCKYDNVIVKNCKFKSFNFTPNLKYGGLYNNIQFLNCDVEEYIKMNPLARCYRNPGYGTVGTYIDENNKPDYVKYLCSCIDYLAHLTRIIDLVTYETSSEDSKGIYWDRIFYADSSEVEMPEIDLPDLEGMSPAAYLANQLNINRNLVKEKYWLSQSRSKLELVYKTAYDDTSIDKEQSYYFYSFEPNQVPISEDYSAFSHMDSSLATPTRTFIESIDASTDEDFMLIQDNEPIHFYYCDIRKVADSDSSYEYKIIEKPNIFVYAVDKHPIEENQESDIKPQYLIWDCDNINNLTKKNITLNGKRVNSPGCITLIGNYFQKNAKLDVISQQLIITNNIFNQSDSAKFCLISDPNTTIIKDNIIPNLTSTITTISPENLYNHVGTQVIIENLDLEGDPEEEEEDETSNE